MLGFTLSKMNLLIFVLAIFGIVAYFTAGLCEITKVKELDNLLERMTKGGGSLVNSPTHCDSTYYFLPEEVEVCGDTYYYTVTVSKQSLTEEINGVDREFNYVIFSAYPRKDKDFEHAVAANSFKTDADVRIIKKISETGGGIDEASEGEFAVLDPQARVPDDALAMVKEVMGGETTLYLIPCNKNSAVCEDRKERAGCWLKYGRACNTDEVGFNC